MKFIPLKGEKDMKKWLVLLSTMLLIVGIIAGCGSKDSDDIKSVTGEGQKKETEAKDKDKEKDKDEELVVDEPEDPEEPEEPEEVVNKDEDKDEDKEKDKEKKDKKKDKKKSNTDDLLMGVDENMVKNVEVVFKQELDE